MARTRNTLLLALLGATLARCAATVDVPPGFTATVFARGLVRPTAMAFAPDGRLFVCEQAGTLRVVTATGTLLPKPFVTVPVHAHRERGLIGVALDPDFASNGFVYVYYTALQPRIHNRLSRFTADGNRARAGSEKVLIDLPDLRVDREVHNGGALHFGRDGKLYVSVGENHSAEEAQSFANPLGKLLRVNRDGTIPADNPFYGRTVGLARAIWALGLRNPFTFAVSPESGRILIDDVGDKNWEEINDGVAGANFGWPVTEGPTTDPRFRSPLYAYPHGAGAAAGCAITGGTFYEPATMLFPSAYSGGYLFCDFCRGWVRRLDLADLTTHDFATGLAGPVDLDVGADGALYALGYEAGDVIRIGYSASLAPRIVREPADLTVTVGGTANFSVEATGATPLAYQWRRDGQDLPGATAAVLELPDATLADDGAQLEARVANAHGAAVSRRARLHVTTDRPPVATIAAPGTGTVYRAGDTIDYAGGAIDPETGPLPASALTWWINLHHETHHHPFLLETSGVTAGSLVVPTTGETSPDVYFRIHLRAVDTVGLRHETSVDVRPVLSTFRLETDPPGPTLRLDGVPVVTPHVVTGVVGVRRTIAAASPQTTPAGVFEFASWSDGGAASHEIATPAVASTFTARFRPRAGGLLGTYFDRPNLTGARVSRRDPVIDFDFTGRAPAPGIAADDFSVRWSGRLQPKVTGRTTLYVRSDDGARLWINGVRVIDHWAAHTSTLDRVTLDLVAGSEVPIVLEYWQHRGAGRVRLLWSAPGLDREVVPESQLSP